MVGSCVLIGLLLSLSGVQLWTVLRSEEIKFEPTNVQPGQISAHAYVEEIQVHWPMHILIWGSLLGFAMALIPSRRKIPPRIQS